MTLHTFDILIARKTVRRADASSRFSKAARFIYCSPVHARRESKSITINGRKKWNLIERNCILLVPRGQTVLIGFSTTWKTIIRKARF